MTVTGTLDPTDPYNDDKQFLELKEGGLTTTLPRMIAGAGNGAITFNNIASSSIILYQITYKADTDQWQLKGLSPESGPAILLATSTVENTVPKTWSISYSSVNLTIVDQNAANPANTIPFANNTTLAFHIWDIPTVEHGMTVE